MKKIIFTAFITVTIFSSCTVIRNGITKQAVAVNSLKYLGEYIVPYNQPFKGTTVGGLSGIDYDSLHQLYYLISDDRSTSCGILQTKSY